MYLSELYSELYKFEGKYYNFCFYNFRNFFEKSKGKLFYSTGTLKERFQFDA